MNLKLSKKNQKPAQNWEINKSVLSALEMAVGALIKIESEGKLSNSN